MANDENIFSIYAKKHNIEKYNKATKEIDKDILDKYSINSKRKVKITCSICGHEYEKPLMNYYREKSPCNYCRSLAGWCKQHWSCGGEELYNAYRKELNDGKEIDKVNHATRGILYFKCPRCGATWKGKGYSITQNIILCPKCHKTEKTSFPEQAIFYELSKITEAKNREKVFGKEIDIYLPKFKIGVEYNGDYWHRNKKDEDKAKIEFFRSHGIKIISINEYKVSSDIPNSSKDSYTILYGNNRLNYYSELSDIINDISKKYLNITTSFDVEKDYQTIWNTFNTGHVKNNFGDAHPELVEAFWDFDKNTINPYTVPKTKAVRVYLKCKNCGHEFTALVGNMNNIDQHKFAGCPKCGYFYKKSEKLYKYRLRQWEEAVKKVKRYLNNDYIGYNVHWAKTWYRLQKEKYKENKLENSIKELFDKYDIPLT